MNTRNFVLAAVLAVAWSGSALAKSETSPSPVTPIPPARTLAGDVQVINPAAPPPAPAPPPPAVQPGTTVIVPTVPTEQAPVAPPAPRTQKVVHEDVESHHSYMTTIAASEAVSSRAGSPDPAPTHRLGLVRIRF
jgi:hypothetical protein